MTIGKYWCENSLGRWIEWQILIKIIIWIFNASEFFEIILQYAHRCWNSTRIELSHIELSIVEKFRSASDSG